MSAARAESYPTLLSEIQPEVVHDEAMNERFISILHDLDRRWDALTTDERRLHELLVLIIQDFEERTYKIRAATPIEVIEELMAANNLKNKDLVGIFPTESVVSEVLNGKRGISKTQAKALADYFHVPADLFI